VGPTVGREASAAIDQVRRDINTAADPYYFQTHFETVSPAEMRRIRALPGWDEAAHAVRNDPQLNRYVAGAPEDSVAFLNEVRKYMRTAGENATQPLTAQGRNMQRAAGWHADAEVVDQAARRASNQAAAGGVGNFEMAQAIEHDLRGRYLQPLLEGPLGKLAKDDLTTKNAIETLFP